MKRKILTLVLALVMILGCMASVADAATYNLDISSVVAQEELYEATTLGNFTIKATGDKFVQVQATGNADEGTVEIAEDGTALPYVLKLCGAANGGDFRRVDFTITEKTTFKVYTRSNGGERELGLWDANSTEVDEAGKPIPMKTWVAPDKGLAVVGYEVELEAGSYYFASTSGGVNIYDIIATDNTGAVAKDGESNMVYVAMLACAVAAMGCVYFSKRKNA